MKKNWKRLLLPGLGGIVVGLAAVALGRKFQGSRAEFQLLSEVGETFDLVFEQERSSSELVYRCRQTPFKVWSLIGGTLDALGTRGQSRVYYVQINEAGDFLPSLRESLYATLHGVAQDGRHTRAGEVALGCAVEFRECRVGGAVNGVETGRRFRSGGLLKRLDAGRQEPVPAQNPQKT